MTRAFSLTSDALGYFIGFTLLHSEQVIIVSPWLSDVALNLPVNDRFDSREVSLIEAVTEFADDPEKDIRLFVRAGESHNDYIKTRLPESVEYREIEDLHAKAVVCDEFVYMGSANITLGGLTLNRELCEIIENPHESAGAYISKNLGIDV